MTSLRDRAVRLRGPATVLASAALAFSVVALIVRAQPVSSVPRLVLAVGATFVPLIAVTGLLLAVWCRRATLAVVGAVVVAVSLAVQVNWYYVGHPGRVEPYTELRILSSNLRYGLADPAEFVAVASRTADVITVAEMTAAAVQRFQDAGIAENFPYSHLLPAPAPGGTGIWSRYPLDPLTAPRHRNASMPAARVQVPGVAAEPLVASVHIMSPVAGDENTVADWSAGMAGAKAQLENFAVAAGPAATIVGGDYNSTPDMRQYRDLLTNGYHDAVDQTGAGFAPTFKADSWGPPLITIDHILTRNAEASSIRTVKITGTDHRALLATVRVPLATAP